ncbi:MAG TPA: prepilin-type N-terminal cleavage/methylation domain-containing protein [Povalibacter sp.]|nr:prepilin-type N-terminal cleavage/methylation domain-containing protein [Povalibacter sp.]
MTRRVCAGFTLIEMVVAIVIGGIVIGFVAMFMTAPVEAYFAQSRRTDLIQDQSEATRQLREDLQHALPNSVRIRVSGTRAIVEMLRVENDVFYNADGEAGSADVRELKVGSPDEKFAVFPQFTASPGSWYAVVGNTGTGTTSAYRFSASATSGVIAALANTSAQDAANRETQLQLASAFRFPATGSAARRLFLVSGPVTYICNSAGNVAALRRYSGYPITQNIPTSESSAQLAGAASDLVVDNVASCSVRCWVGTAPCQGALIVDMSLRRTAGSGNETARVFAQIPLDDRS